MTTTQHTETITFEVGKIYTTGQGDYTWTYEVVRRTAKFVTLRDVDTDETVRVGIEMHYTGRCETCLPHGRYSMAAVLNADDVVLAPVVATELAATEQCASCFTPVAIVDGEIVNVDGSAHVCASVEISAPVVQAWVDQCGRHHAVRAPQAGDRLDFTEFGRVKIFDVDYVVSERVIDGVRQSVCGVSWPNEACDVRPEPRAGSTITVLSMEPIR